MELKINLDNDILIPIGAIATVVVLLYPQLVVWQNCEEDSARIPPSDRTDNLATPFPMASRNPAFQQEI